VPQIDSFGFQPGRVLAGKYVIDRKLGGGWEGEVYKVIELLTGLSRAAKLFKPQRNERDRAVKFYARKLERLRDCSIVIQYHSSETIRFRGQPITCLISDHAGGEPLSDFISRQRGKRLTPFEALHLIHSLARGIEEIHLRREYHGDLHDGNVLIRRRGVFFDLKVVDFYGWGRPTAAHMREDVADIVRLLYDAIGGRKHYAKQPPEIKAVCKGLRRDLIGRAFPTASHLREYLESFVWPVV
jgi:tRNA A-37 threonylcarbamoyl transferase component Bud32